MEHKLHQIGGGSNTYPLLRVFLESEALLVNYRCNLALINVDKFLHINNSDAIEPKGTESSKHYTKMMVSKTF